MESPSAVLRHAIRGTLNAMKLCATALDLPMEPAEKLEFLSEIEAAAAEMDRLMVEVESAPDAPVTPNPTPS